MFSKLISRNSRRNRKENGLFFASLLIAIIAFYIILSLSHQDVMVFLTQMESDAVDKLLTLLPVFYGLTLFILFFLIYYASKFQLERRRHEFGVYLMLGMRRIKLFALLLAEDLYNSLLALLIGLPTAILLSELISLITARLVGIGIINHRFSLSLWAVLWTTFGVLLIKFAAFLILSGKISRREIGSLLVDLPEGMQKQLPGFLYMVSVLIGLICLGIAYRKAIIGEAWSGLGQMGLTVVLGLSGTFLFFYGLRFPLGFLAGSVKKNRQLHVFNFRQIQESVIHRSGTLAVCSLLILAALCCFGAGVSISRFYGKSEQHVLDCTFRDNADGNNTEAIRQTLAAHNLDTLFSDLFEVKTGYMNLYKHSDHPLRMEPVLDALRKLPSSRDKDTLLSILEYGDDYPHLISQSGYNHLLAAAGMPGLNLAADEAAVYMDTEAANDIRTKLLNSVLENRPEILLGQEEFHLTGTVQTLNLVTDRSITLFFALIVPDEVFEHYTQGSFDTYLNGILSDNATQNKSLMSALSDMNHKLSATGLTYESYLQNMSRQLFYMVAASYITIYLAIIFLIIANTIIGVQFLMSQQKAGRRYKILIHLGAAHPVLCKSSRKQINWYFGIPAVFAAYNSLFGVNALLTGILPSSLRNNFSEIMVISAAMILALCVIEYIYITAVKRASDRYLLTLMVPEREE